MKHNQQHKPKEVRTEKKKKKYAMKFIVGSSIYRKKNATFTDIYNSTDFSHTGSKREFRVE